MVTALEVILTMDWELQQLFHVIEQKNILSSTDKISEITITPIPFTENKTGEIIAEISMPNSSANSFHLLKFNDPTNNDFSLVPDTHFF